MLLQSKIALVTGATSGIGKAIALAFLQEGAIVYGIGTNPKKGEELISSARALGYDQLTFIPCDVSKKESVDALFQAIYSKHEALDILVNNAGITKDGLFMKMKEEDWTAVLNTNLTSCFYTVQNAIRPMLKARHGRIINISSVVGLIGNPGQTNYAASKAGMIGFSKALAREVASRGILVNCIAPGYIETEMTNTLPEEKKALACQSIPLQRMGTTVEVAKAALFLASDLSSYITGQVLVVDGGLS
jgi:3-oxoacyl-[acyl-carrier protein] reductase